MTTQYIERASHEVFSRRPATTASNVQCTMITLQELKDFCAAAIQYGREGVRCDFCRNPNKAVEMFKKHNDESYEIGKVHGREEVRDLELNSPEWKLLKEELRAEGATKERERILAAVKSDNEPYIYIPELEKIINPLPQQ